MQHLCTRIVDVLKLRLPPLNTPLVLQRLERGLSLAPAVLGSSLALLDIVPFEQLPQTEAQVTDRAALMAYLVVAMKLVYGFDDQLGVSTVFRQRLGVRCLRSSVLTTNRLIAFSREFRYINNFLMLRLKSG